MHDHFKPPEHFTYWQGTLYRLGGLAFVAVGLILLAVYVMPWLGAHYFDPLTDWTAPRFAAIFQGHDILGTIVLFAIIGTPWAASHLYARRLAKRNREKASADTSQ
jgi:hypothetical protein